MVLFVIVFQKRTFILLHTVHMYIFSNTYYGYCDVEYMEIYSWTDDGLLADEMIDYILKTRKGNHGHLLNQ